MAINDFDALIVHHKPLTELILKRLILVFDHVYILSPQQHNVLIPQKYQTIVYPEMTVGGANYGALYNGKKIIKSEEQLVDKFDYAFKKGVVRVLDPTVRNFYQKYWLSLRFACDFDTANPTLLKSTRPLLEINENAQLGDGIIRGGFAYPTKYKALFPETPPGIDFFNGEDGRKYNLEAQACSLIGKLNRSVALCGHCSLIPAFVDRNFANLYMEKCKMATQNRDPLLKQTFYERNNVELEKIQYFLYKVSEEILPDKVLMTIPIKEFIIARTNTIQELYKLRRNLINTLGFLSKHQFDENFLLEIDRYIAKEISPLIESYSSKFKGSILDKFNLVGKNIGLATVSTIISTWQSLSPLETILYTGVSATIGDACSNLLTLSKRTKQQKLRNTYTYFFDIKD